jgi:hypothetical protein
MYTYSEYHDDPRYAFKCNTGGWVFKTEGEAREFCNIRNAFLAVMATIADVPTELNRSEYEQVCIKLDIVPMTDQEIERASYALHYGDFIPPTYTGEYAREMSLAARRLRSIEAEKEARTKQRQDEWEKRATEQRQAKFAQARETGKPVILAQWMSDDCDLPDCGMDNVIEYAMPDGSTQTTRYHSY